MPWYYYVAYFFGGAFLANAVPHFVNGVSGRPFPTPFASPPGRGLSSPLLNVLWGALNAAAGWFLVFRVAEFDVYSRREVGVVGVGGLLLSLMLSRTFRRLHGGQQAAD